MRENGSVFLLLPDWVCACVCWRVWCCLSDVRVVVWGHCVESRKCWSKRRRVKYHEYPRYVIRESLDTKCGSYCRRSVEGFLPLYILYPYSAQPWEVWVEFLCWLESRLLFHILRIFVASRGGLSSLLPIANWLEKRRRASRSTLAIDCFLWYTIFNSKMFYWRKGGYPQYSLILISVFLQPLFNLPI